MNYSCKHAFVNTRNHAQLIYHHIANRYYCSTLAVAKLVHLYDHTVKHQYRNWNPRRGLHLGSVYLSRIITLPTRNMSSSTSLPSIHVTPRGRRLLVDDELTIAIDGLLAKQAITVFSKLTDDGKSFESCCCFVADDRGIVDFSKDPSVSGSYTGVSRMGVFWSMAQSPGQRSGLRLMKKKVNVEPFTTKLEVYTGHLTADDIQRDHPVPIQSVSIDRWFMASDVTMVPVRDGRVRGAMFMPPGPGPFPGVIDMFGTGGGLFEFRAALLASRGIATLALAYFAYDDLPKDLMKEELDLEYFLEASDWLLAQDKICKDGIGIVAVSKGGDISMLMGAYSPKVKAIVNINGCSFSSIIPIKYKKAPGGSIKAVEIQYDRVAMEDGACRFSEAFDYTKDDIIPVWNHGAKVLVLVSEDDKCGVPSSLYMLEQQYPADQSHNLQLVSYPDAGHLLEPPYSPLCSVSYHKVYDMNFLWGGYPRAHADAQEDSWRRIIKFIKDNVCQSSSKHVPGNL